MPRIKNIYDLSAEEGDEKYPARMSRRSSSHRPNTQRHKELNWAELQAGVNLPDVPQIGIGLWVNLKPIINKDVTKLLLVYGVYRRKPSVGREHVVALDMLSINRAKQTLYTSDLPIQSSFGLVTKNPRVISCNKILTLPYTKKYFIPGEVGKISTEILPDLIARRAHALLFHGYSEVHQAGNALSPDVTRTGFTLDIPPEAVRSGLYSPDLPGGDFQREASELVSPAELERIIAHVNCKGQKKMQKGIFPFQYAPYSTWRQNLPVARPFPVWRREAAATEDAPGNTAG